MFNQNTFLEARVNPDSFISLLEHCEAKKDYDTLNEFLDVLNQLNCSTEVLDSILKFDYLINWFSDERKHDISITYQLTATITDLILGRDLSYEKLMQSILTYCRYEELEEFCAELFSKLFRESPYFRNAFIVDDLYKPFLDQKTFKYFFEFVDAGTVDEEVLADIKRIKHFPPKHELKEKYIEEVYQFPKPYSNEQKSIIEVAKFLSDKNKVLTQLYKLENLLKNRKQELENQKISFDKENLNQYKNHKLLSSVLYQWAETNGFKGNAKITQELPPETMFEVFAKGLLIKDKEFRGEFHGEWIHFLQWFALTEGNKQEKILSVDPPQLLQWIGETKNENVWDSTFEGTSTEYGISAYRPEEDFRTFYDFNRFLIGNECKCLFPTLHECIFTRALKRKVDKAGEERGVRMVFFNSLKADEKSSEPPTKKQKIDNSPKK